LNALINKLILRKMKKIKWFFVTNYGRYALGLLLLLTGIFSEYSTIDFLSTDYGIFVITTNIGVVILVGQFLFHVIGAIVVNIINRKKK